MNRLFPPFSMLFFDCTDSFLRLNWMIPLISLVFSFDFTEASSPQRLHGEPSLSQRRALAVSITSLRQLVESKGTAQSIHKCGSDNTLKRFSQSTKAPQTIHKSTAWKAFFWKILSRNICSIQRFCLTLPPENENEPLLCSKFSSHSSYKGA